jgi:arsenate reductase (thioredoxin)
LKSFDKNITVCSAGTEPAKQLNQTAVKVMKEVGIDISQHTPKLVDQYLDEDWNYVITVCDHANETCPAFFGNVKQRLHLGFEDPSHATGTDEFILNEFRRTRGEIKSKFYEFYIRNLKI